MDFAARVQRLSSPLRTGELLRLALKLASALLLACGPATSDHRLPPNVLLIVADDLGAGDLGHRGSPSETPHLDRLFRDGVSLQRFYSSPLCTPTRAAILTGRAPIRFGLQYNALQAWSTNGLPSEEITLADHLGDAGYRTALVGKWHLGHASADYHPNARGFEHFFGHLLGGDYFEHTFMGGHDLQRNGVSVHPEGYATSLLADEAVRVIEERDVDRPLFLTLAFYAPHVPLQAPEPLRAKYAEIRGAGIYAAVVDALDQAVGRVLDALAREGIADDTLVIFVSDNGAQPGPGRNAPFRGRKGETFEGGIRVPAALRWPGVLPAGSASNQRMRDHDLLPTILGAAGVEISNPELLDGANVWPALRSGRNVARPPFFFASRVKRETTFRAVVDDHWKLVTRDGRGETELLLFDLAEDPGEQRDLAGDHPDVVARLLAGLDDWEALHPDGLPKWSGRPRDFVPPLDWSQLSARRGDLTRWSREPPQRLAGGADLAPVGPPADAIELIGGRRGGCALPRWERGPDKCAGWKQRFGIATPPNSRSVIRTRAHFADFQLHLEWRVRSSSSFSSRRAANLGLPGGFELVLHSEGRGAEAADSLPGSIRRIAPASVIFEAPNHGWQSLDLVFAAARSVDDEPARITSMINGVMLHHSLALENGLADEPAGPLTLRTQAAPIQLRNFWVRAVSSYDAGATDAPEPGPEPHQPGASLRLFDVAEPMAHVLPLAPDQAPNEDRVIATIRVGGSAGPLLARDGTSLDERALVEIEGELIVERSGVYDLQVRGGRAVELELSSDGSVREGTRGDTERQLRRVLRPGAHPYRLQVVANASDVPIELLWRTPLGGDFEPIPPSALRTHTGVRVVSPGRKQVVREPDRRRPGDGRGVVGVHPGYRLTNVAVVPASRTGPRFVPRVGAMAFHPNGDLYVGTFDPPVDVRGTEQRTRSAIWRLAGVANGSGTPARAARLPVRVAEPMGMLFVGDDLYVSQRDNLLRLRDRNGDGLPDDAQPITSGWTWDNFHHFSPGLVRRREGDTDYLYGGLSVSIARGGDSLPNPPLRGSVYRIALPDSDSDAADLSDIEVVAGGFRTPDGFGLGPGDEIFVTDNQGSWLPAGKLIHLKPGRFFGHHNPLGRHPQHGYQGERSAFEDRAESPAAVLLPYMDVSRSPTDVLAFANDGPFAGQLMLGELTKGGIRRVFLERVGGELQGAVFRFSQGFEAGVHRLVRGPDGHVYVGMIGATGNWAWRGKTAGLQRLERRREAPEVHEMKAVRAIGGGFEIEFTTPVARHVPLERISVEHWYYQPTKSYGGAKQDRTALRVSFATRSDDGLRLRLGVGGLEAGRVVHLQVDVPSERGTPPWSTDAWYTLNRLPVE